MKPMRQAGALLFTAAGLLLAQQGQEGSTSSWPCVPGRAVDPAYLETSESTGGQLFLFQKGEVAQSGPVLSASYTHPATILRAIGNLNGNRDFEFPVDSGVSSLLVLASVQCRTAIRVSRPNGAEMTAANSSLSVDLQAGRILRVNSPETGKWRVSLSGTGLYVLSVQAKAEVGLTSIEFPRDDSSARRTQPLFGVAQTIAAHISGEVSQMQLQLVDAAATPISSAAPVESAGSGNYKGSLTPLLERFRVLITGTDAVGTPFQRIYPVLFRAETPTRAGR